MANFPFCTIKPGQKYSASDYWDETYEKRQMLLVPSRYCELLGFKYNPFLDRYSELSELGAGILLPELLCVVMEEYEEFEKRQVLNYIKSRSCVDEEKRYGIDMGIWRSEDKGLTQEFALSAKGTGTKLSQTKVSKKRMKQAAKRLGLDNIVMDLINKFDPDKELFVGNVTHSSNRAQGAQHKGYAEGSLSTCTGRIKSAPTIYAYEFPKKIIQFIKASTGLQWDALNLLNALSFSQEIRLMPSLLRGMYLDTASGYTQLAEMCKLLSNDPDELAHGLERMMDDGAEMLEALAAKTRFCGRRLYETLILGDCVMYHHNTDSGWEKYKSNTKGWYISKDLVLALSGLWFVDLESYYTETYNSSDLRKVHKLETLNILRDIMRIGARMRVGIELVRGRALEPNECKALQQEAVEQFYSAVNQKKNVYVYEHDSNVVVQLGYPNAETDGEYRHDLAHIRLPY